MAAIRRTVRFKTRPCMDAVAAYVGLLREAGFWFETAGQADDPGTCQIRLTEAGSAQDAELDEDDLDQQGLDAGGLVVFDHYLRTVELLASDVSLAEKWLRNRGGM